MFLFTAFCLSRRSGSLGAEQEIWPHCNNNSGAHRKSQLKPFPSFLVCNDNNIFIIIWIAINTIAHRKSEVKHLSISFWYQNILKVRE